MSFERQHAGNESDRAAGAASRDAELPGRHSATEHLTSGGGPVPSGLVQRKAERDDNGVAAGAESAVAAAAGSSGFALPSELRRSFESSLGADLSSVRVHTGDASASAAHAVGARAYAVGQDIHFGAGQYDPGSAGGMHLLAHEVAHTVQQQGGSPSRQHKLEVSRVHDGAEVEADAAADAMVAGRSFAIGGGGGSVSRSALFRDKGDAKPDPFPGPPPPTPFDETKISPKVQQAVDTLTLDSMRALTNAKINHAYTNFGIACGEVKAKLMKEKKDREDAEKELRELAIGAAGFLLSGVGAAIGAKMAGAAPGMQQSVVAQVREGVAARLKSEGTPVHEIADLSEEAARVVDARLAKLVAGLTPEKAAGLVGDAAKKLAGVMAKVDVRGSVEEKAWSYVDALLLSGDRSSSALLAAVGTCTDLGTLMGVYQQYAGASMEVYRADIDTRAHHFATQVASTVGAGHRAQIVSIQAYGRERLANCTYMPSSMNFAFNSWVTPDLEPMVRQLNPDPMKVSPAAIVDHLPEPTMEGAAYGQELVMRTNAWGRLRLVMARAAKNWWSKEYGVLEFAGWVPKDEEAVAEVKGASQIGGVPEVDPGKLKGLQAPKD